MLCQVALQMGIPALALELGGGITTWPEDVETGVRAILSLLAHWNYISRDHAASRTPPERVYPRDDRIFVRAQEEGVFYPLGDPGQALSKGDRIGTWVSLTNLEAHPIAAPDAGTVVYLRSRCRTHGGDTLAMALPEVPVKCGNKE